MKCLETPIAGLLLFEPTVYPDDRGYFFEAFRDDFLKKQGIHSHFVQDNQSRSAQGVLRGLHYQTGEFSQSKLIRVLRGEILDVAVDLRENSPFFGRSYSVVLSEYNQRQLYIPKGFAHGFLTLSPTADILYKCDTYYHKNAEAGIRYNDPELKIDWGFAPSQLILSEKDTILPLLGNHSPAEIPFIP
ncbi:dTDP-4-dehydrorhamnose 3,5-epimerase [Bacteroidota bacterium]|nr:dTDP-4-dehydrorhamnose 3,5-epimerase [Bacteroidota bacterium]